MASLPRSAPSPREPRRPLPRPPHPSWSVEPEVAANRKIVSAREFWLRLGL
jgi:hypothetical protein